MVVDSFVAEDVGHRGKFVEGAVSVEFAKVF
jgi:hypothetical protein